MDPITNSTIKERYRINNESAARTKEISINQKLYQDINALQKKSASLTSTYVIKWGLGLGFVFGIIIGVSSRSFGIFWIAWIISIIVAVIIWKSANKGINDRKAELEQKARDDINSAYANADKKTRDEIARYDKEVVNYFNKIKNNKDNLDRMADFACKLFDSALADASNKASNSERFVILDFMYAVSMINIVYNSSVRRSGMYDFKTERYRALDRDTECEALAAALSKMIGGYVLKKYGSAQGKLHYSNNDASVSMRFEMPNKHFIPATVIV